MVSDSRFPRIWGFSRISGISKISRKWTFLKRPHLPKDPFFPSPNHKSSCFRLAGHLDDGLSASHDQLLRHQQPSAMAHRGYQYEAAVWGIDQWSRVWKLPCSCIILSEGLLDRLRALRKTLGHISFVCWVGPPGKNHLTHSLPGA